MVKSDSPATKPVSRMTVGILTLVMGAIAVALLLVLVFAVVKIDIFGAYRLAIGAFLSIAGSFALFFSAIAFQGVTFVFRPRDELMSIRGWRFLALTLALLAGVCAIAFHWVALLVPLIMALICLLKDPMVREWIHVFGI